jgi:hypothetical protein
MYDMSEIIFFGFADYRPHYTTIQKRRQQD